MTSRDGSPGAVVGMALLLVTSVALATVGFAGAAGAQSQSQADVVFVFDKTGSMDEEAAALKQEIGNVSQEIESSGIDAQYALITYESEANTEVRQPLTPDTAKLGTALEFNTEGGTENVSNAMLFALDELSYRENAQRIMIVLSDEDDDGTPEARRKAVQRLNDQNVTLLTVAETDSSGDNDLRNIAEEQVDDGFWTDIGTEQFSDIVSRIIGIVQQATSGASEDDDPTLSNVDVNTRAEDSADAGGTGVSAEGGEITTSFESEENPVNMEIVVEGPNGTTTLTREDVSGDPYEGYEATFESDEPGNYTVTIRQARTDGNDDLLRETGEITRTVTIGDDNGTDAANGTEAENETSADNETDAEPTRERPACTTAEVPDEVTVDGESVSTVPPADAEGEWLETTTAEVDGEQRRVRLVDTTGDGEPDLAVVDRDGDGDVDPTCGQFRTTNPNLDWETWAPAVD